MRGNATLFARRDEVELTWNFLDPVVQSYDRGDGPALSPYAEHSQGPSEADAMLARAGHAWRALP